MAEKKLTLKNKDEAAIVFGIHDRNLRKIRKVCDVAVVARDGEIKITGKKKDVDRAAKTFDVLMDLAKDAGVVREADVLRALGEKGEKKSPERSKGQGLVDARTDGQSAYLEALNSNDIVFAIGPAGTGKTFLAVARAMEEFQAGNVQRIILCRPAVEAGESLGFLPGDLHAKVDPYLRPLYDAMNAFLEFGQLRRLLDSEVVEIVPLAYMRGRTLDDAYIIMDEAQNTTAKQMKMFLTRMGMRSKIVVTGDHTQIDLHASVQSGLKSAIRLLDGLPGISFCYLKREDIVRHPLVQRIVEAYEAEESGE
jgi:phosphate starvation-inducible PhoH-like protein